MPLSSDLKEFVASLNSNKVEYLAIGARSQCTLREKRHD